MGVGLSLELASSISITRKWSWEHVTRIVDTFLEEEYDFDLENTAVEKLTGMNSNEADALVVALTRRVDAEVNGITLLVALILLTEDSSASIEQRTATLYRLMDFDGSGEITMEEMGIILFCLAMATSFILQRHRLCPTALEVKQINESLFSTMGKQVTSCLSKEEFMQWAAVATSNGEDTTIFDVYKYFVTATGNEAMKKDADKAEAKEAELQLQLEKQRVADAAKEKADKDAADEVARVKANNEAADKAEKAAAKHKAEQEKAAQQEAEKVAAEKEAAAKDNEAGANKGGEQ